MGNALRQIQSGSVAFNASQNFGGSACRYCAVPLTVKFADLGMTPLANSFVPSSRASSMEPFYPLCAYVCESCHLVQLTAFESPKAIFGEYLYFSSFSESWLRHAELYVLQMVERFALGPETLVVEVASNDGYLLQYFKQRDIPVLGVDPAANVAASAVARGVPTEIAFFGSETAQRLQEQGVRPKLMVANNVLAHVPDLHDFVEGFRILLEPDGVVTFEFPHLLRLIHGNQFDTIYHEHFSYLSLATVEMLLENHSLRVFDVEELPTHGGSLRVYARHRANMRLAATPAVLALREVEIAAGFKEISTYERFSERVVESKLGFLDFLINARRSGNKVAAYGAPAKGNTLLNYCGVGPELIAFTVDLNPHKQGHLLPGTRIPIYPPSAVSEERPDYLVILPWNLREEIASQMAGIRSWGGRFVVPIPRVEVF